MARIDKLIRELTKAIKETNKQKTNPYDAKAVVKRVDGNTAWVHLDGGVDETPVQMTINANVGDTVLVRMSGGRAWITGNNTAPPTDDKLARKAFIGANSAMKSAKKAKETADKVGELAEDANELAGFALASANGKNTVYYSSTEPEEPEEGFKEGDTWFDTANDNRINEWDGEQWVPFELGEDAIADLAITNAKIANATIQSAKIAGLDVGKLTGGYIDAGHINTLELVVGNDKTLGDTFDEYDDTFEDIDTAFDNIDTEMSDMADDIDDLENEVDDAATKATNFITSISSANGIWVTPSDHKPDSSGDPVTTGNNKTTGWHISDALELFRLGMSHFKVWVESNATKVRIGPEEQHLLLSNGSIDLQSISQGVTSVLASFSSNIINLGNGTKISSSGIETAGVYVKSGNTTKSSVTTAGITSGGDVETSTNIRLNDHRHALRTGMFDIGMGSSAGGIPISANHGTNDYGSVTVSHQSNFYPIGIVGWYLDGTNVSVFHLYNFYLSDRAAGSCKVNYGVRNTHATLNASGTLYPRILWINTDYSSGKSRMT